MWCCQTGSSLLFALPTTVAFPEREATVGQGWSERPSCRLDDVNRVNHPQQMTLGAGWTNTGGPGGEVGRKPLHEGSGGISKCES